MSSLKRVTASVAAAFGDDSDSDTVETVDRGTALTITSTMRAHAKKSKASSVGSTVGARHPLPHDAVPLEMSQLPTLPSAPRSTKSRFSDKPTPPSVIVPQPSLVIPTISQPIVDQPPPPVVAHPPPVRKRRRFCENPDPADRPPKPVVKEEPSVSTSPIDDVIIPQPPPPVDLDPDAQDLATFEATMKARAIGAAAIARLGLAQPGVTAVDDSLTDDHRRRALEIAEFTSKTDDSSHRHHIGHYLPDDDKRQFGQMLASQFAGGSTSSTSTTAADGEYAANRLQGDNKGFAIMQKMGWNSEKGLGAKGQGIVTPIGSGRAAGDRIGLGAGTSAAEESTDVFAEYRSRLTKAYKNRPNPFKNPRREYK